MSAGWLYDLDILILAIGSIAALLACAAAGQWIGARFRSQELDSALTVTIPMRLLRRSPCGRARPSGPYG